MVQLIERWKVKLTAEVGAAEIFRLRFGVGCRLTTSNHPTTSIIITDTGTPAPALSPLTTCDFSSSIIAARERIWLNVLISQRNDSMMHHDFSYQQTDIPTPP